MEGKVLMLNGEVFVYCNMKEIKVKVFEGEGKLIIESLIKLKVSLGIIM